MLYTTSALPQPATREITPPSQGMIQPGDVMWSCGPCGDHEILTASKVQRVPSQTWMMGEECM